MAVECHYKLWEIDETPFLSAMKLAEYWGLEPPLSLLYYRSHFRMEGEEQPADAIQPDLDGGRPYAQLPEGIKYSVRKMWLRRNPGKTEADFFKAVQKKADKKYAARLEEARKKKQNG
jgi:hypothetical protein